MSKYIDLNCDMGESYYDKIVGNDSKIMPYITSCNIACGFHGGDPLTIGKTIKLAIDNKVKIGAHPSYFDLEGFGRRKIHLNLKELESIILYQVSAIKGITEYYGEKLHHVKPHGALYNSAAKNKILAKIICNVVETINPKMPIMCLAGSPMVSVIQNMGLKPISEAFADRTYERDGSLRKRTLSKALIENPIEAAKQAKCIFLQKKVVAYDGSDVPINSQTLCIHSDTPNAIEIAKKIKQVLA